MVVSGAIHRSRPSAKTEGTVTKITLQATRLPIRRLVEDVDRGHLKLPEIQRDYVWKAAQVAGLLDSIYRSYPSGSLLLWETDDVVTERRAKIDPSGAPPAGRRVQYLLDGQQRLTSLHRVFKAHDSAKVVFNYVEQRFQIESAATGRDPRWVRVSDVLATPNLFAFVKDLAEKYPEIDGDLVHDRLSRVKAIGDYNYHVEVMSDVPYEEVTEIFIRVNSRGRSLGATDLALAALSARWHGVMAKLETERDRWKEAYPAIDLGFLARSLAAVATESRQLSGFKETPRESLEEGWLQVRRGLDHLVPLLKKNVGIDHSQLIPSANALVPLVTYLGTRPDKALSDEDLNGMVYWLMGAFLTGRYSQAADTKIAQDAKAARGENPLEALISNLGLLGSKLDVSEQALVGKGAGSPYFLLSYLVAKRSGARDWFFGAEIGLEAQGSQKIEYHHVHPQATIKQQYSKSEVNDLANLAFISSKANKQISARSPAVYFQEVGEEELGRHFVPLDPALRSAHAYPSFVVERRRLLAAAMNEFLESFRPAFVSDAAVAEIVGERLIVNIYPSPDDADRQVEFKAHVNSTEWSGAASLSNVQRFLDDLSDGLTAGITIGAEEISVEGGTDLIEVPIGPLVVSGTLPDWRSMLARELEEAPETGAPDPGSEAWAGARIPIPVLEAE